MTHRVIIAGTAALGTGFAIWLYAQWKWERSMLRETKRGGDFRG